MSETRIRVTKYWITRFERALAELDHQDASPTTAQMDKRLRKIMRSSIESQLESLREDLEVLERHGN